MSILIRLLESLLKFNNYLLGTDTLLVLIEALLDALETLSNDHRLRYALDLAALESFW